ncbi:MAG: hypothetical protein NVSMB19_06250 [Vulcanimicrobiaceae bacterium]
MNYRPTDRSGELQQAAEKAITGLLVMVCDDSPRSHLASVLVDELAGNVTTLSPEVAAAAKSLDEYYAPTRYPDALGGGNPDSAFIESDAVLAIEAAGRIRPARERCPQG